MNERAWSINTAATTVPLTAHGAPPIVMAMRNVALPSVNDYYSDCFRGDLYSLRVGLLPIYSLRTGMKEIR